MDLQSRPRLLQPAGIMKRARNSFLWGGRKRMCQPSHRYREMCQTSQRCHMLPSSTSTRCGHMFPEMPYVTNHQRRVRRNYSFTFSGTAAAPKGQSDCFGTHSRTTRWKFFEVFISDTTWYLSAFLILWTSAHLTSFAARKSAETRTARTMSRWDGNPTSQVCLAC